MCRVFAETVKDVLKEVERLRSFAKSSQLENIYAINTSIFLDVFESFLLFCSRKSFASSHTLISDERGYATKISVAMATLILQLERF